MLTTTPPVPPALTKAGDALRQVLLRLDAYARNQVQGLNPAARYAPAVLAHVKDLEALLSAVEQYEQAALASLPPAPVPVGTLTPAELRAYREADPVYRLGWVRGHKAGVSQGQRTAEPALRLYAEQAALPAPSATGPGYAALVAQVRACLAHLSQRYGAGPIARPLPPSSLTDELDRWPRPLYQHRPAPTAQGGPRARCYASTSPPGSACLPPRAAQGRNLPHRSARPPFQMDTGLPQRLDGVNE